MTEEMRKRLEEAAKKYADEKFPGHRASENNRRAREDYQLCRDSHIAGAEHGYKEAITQAKEWLTKRFGMEYSPNEWQKLLANFESDMNICLDENK